MHEAVHHLSKAKRRQSSQWMREDGAEADLPRPKLFDQRSLQGHLVIFTDAKAMDAQAAIVVRGDHLRCLAMDIAFEKVLRPFARL